MTQKKQYQTPEVEILDARVERGFFLSSGTGEQLEEGEVVDNNNFTKSAYSIFQQLFLEYITL